MSSPSLPAMGVGVIAAPDALSAISHSSSEAIAVGEW
jgi:hypothetical protein